MRAIVPFQVPAVTPSAPARLKVALTVVSSLGDCAALGVVGTTPATAVEQKEASR